MESDSDRDDDMGPPPSQEELDAIEMKKNQFRTVLMEWKKKYLSDLTKEAQDTTVLNIFLKVCATLFYELRDVIEGRQPSKTLVQYSVWKHIQKLHIFPVREPLLRIELSQVIFRDLVEFPFTFNSRLANSFLNRNSLEDTKIVPNK
jgi:hypothetical protein